jgi:hypothetical protein
MKASSSPSSPTTHPREPTRATSATLCWCGGRPTFCGKPLLLLADRIWNLGQSLALLALVVLKLTGVTDWSWWWVLAPVWISGIVVLPFLCLLVAGIRWNRRGDGCSAIIKTRSTRKRLRGPSLGRVAVGSGLGRIPQIVLGHGDRSSAGAGRMARGRWTSCSAGRPGRIRRKQSPARRRARAR